MITITLPSIYEGALDRAMANIAGTVSGRCQVVVVSPFKPKPFTTHNVGVTWVQEEVPEGCNAGHAAALPYAEGEFITAFCDDHIYSKNWDIIAVEHVSAKQIDIPNLPFLLGLRQVNPPQVGTVFGYYYPYFPFLATATARAGYWYDRMYHQDWGDVDLAMRVWSAGGSAEWSSTGLISPHPDDWRKDGRTISTRDTGMFLDRWAGTMGVGWKTAQVRDYNLDVDLSDPRWIDDKLNLCGNTFKPKCA